MADYTYSQLEGLWEQAGGSATLAPTMAAIALAESGGNSAARNPSGASGLWQILGLPFAGNVFDPLTNAKMAVAKYKSQGLGAWVTYTSGADRKFLQGRSPIQGTDPGNVGGEPKIPDLQQQAAGALGSLTAPFTQLASDFEGLAKVLTWITLPSSWARIISGIIGAAFLGCGVYLIGKEARA
jgi:hypothetical protein